MTTTILSEKPRVVANRRGETLIEIMAAIMVLCVGLVGVLAAIPFGGFRMSQMTEADNSAAVGRNAVRMMKFNGWGNPNSWIVYNPYAPSPQYYSVSNLLDSIWDSDGNRVDGVINLQYPIVVDPLAFDPDSPRPYASSFTPDRGDPLVLLHVCPFPQDSDGAFFAPSGVLAQRRDKLVNWYDAVFHQQDDLISGYYESEDATEFRPRLEMEEKGFIDGGVATVPSFSGRYSWMAFVYPKSSSPVIDRCEFGSVTSADFDAVVFRDRILGDEKAFTAQVQGSGYQGGSVLIDLSTCRDAENNEVNSSEDYARIREQLQQTRYILLAGPDDAPKASLSGSCRPTKAYWYKIANFANVNEHVIRLTLIGPNTPVGWRQPGENRAMFVTALFYPGVIGVYSGSTAF